MPQEYRGCGHTTLAFHNIDIDPENEDLYWELWQCTNCGARHNIPYDPWAGDNPLISITSEPELD